MQRFRRNGAAKAAPTVTLRDERFKPPLPLLAEDFENVRPECGYFDHVIQSELNRMASMTDEDLTNLYLNVRKDDDCSPKVDIIMPNGALAPMVVPATSKLSTLKTTLGGRMTGIGYEVPIPLEQCTFRYVNKDGEDVVVYHDDRPFNSLDMYFPCLSLEQNPDIVFEAELMESFTTLMGTNPHELIERLNEEQFMFRYKLFQSCIAAEQMRGTEGTLHYAFPEEAVLPNIGDYYYTPRPSHEVCEEEVEFWHLPKTGSDAATAATVDLQNKLDKLKDGLVIWFSEDEENFTERVCTKDIFDKAPTDLITLALKKLRKIEDPSRFILQVAGRRTYITRTYPIIRFDYIRSSIFNYREPNLLLRRKATVFSDYPAPEPIFKPFFLRRIEYLQKYPLPLEKTGVQEEVVSKERPKEDTTEDEDFIETKEEEEKAGETKEERDARKKLERESNYVYEEYMYERRKKVDVGKSINEMASRQLGQETPSYWELEDNFRLWIKSLSNYSCLSNEFVYVRFVISIGRHVVFCKETSINSVSDPRWVDSGLMEPDLYLKDIAESSQISYCVVKLNSTKTAETPVFYMNYRLFDWKRRFYNGRYTVSLWPVPKGVRKEDVFKIRPPPENPDTMGCRLDIIWSNRHDTVCVFPDLKEVIKFLSFQKKWNDHLGVEDPLETQLITGKIEQGSELLARLLRLRRVIDVMEVSEEDQEFLWNARLKIKELFPQMLLLLADSPYVFRIRERFGTFYLLLQEWPQLNIDTALEMLDGRYTDRFVRETAVQHLDRALDNDQIQFYLLPLVQAIRYEPYADSALADFLVRRSLMDYRVGQKFFWLVRSEMALFDDAQIHTVCSEADMYIRFALMLEAYCRGNSTYRQVMQRQVEMVNLLTEISLAMKSVSPIRPTTRLHRCLQENRDKLQFLPSPMNPSDQLGELMLDACRVLDSAKRPLMLRWRNPEPMAHLSEKYSVIIFKNGDDLRQDLLTIQVMRIMDMKWKSHNIDHCLSLYDVLPMGANVGMINVVQNCKTINEIQKIQRGVRRFFGTNRKFLRDYFYELCRVDSKTKMSAEDRDQLQSSRYMQNIDRFAISLAGYCVATYVIGIKDRHQDNVLVADDGRFCHIDFGHILGHTKRKLGIDREPTKFLLIDQFLAVVTNTSDDIKSSLTFKEFRNACRAAYYILHYHSRIFIALFRMMRCMELPELRTDDDIQYLHTSLRYDLLGKKEGTRIGTMQGRADVDDAFLKVFDDVVSSDLATNVNWFFHSVKH